MDRSKSFYQFVKEISLGVADHMNGHTFPIWLVAGVMSMGKSSQGLKETEVEGSK